MSKRFLIFGILFCLTAATGVFARDSEDFGSKLTPESFKGVFPVEVKTIAVISPASLPDTDAALEAVKLLRAADYKVKIYPHAIAPAGRRKFSSYPVGKRVADFYAAWNDPENDLILCTRGGSGSHALLSKLDWKKLKPRKDVYFLGFSDITTLHCALNLRGYGRCLPGPSLRTLPGLNPEIIPLMKAMLNGGRVGPLKLQTIVPGECSGYPVAGLLNRLELAHRTGEIASTRGKIIFIENIGGNPARIKMQLESLYERKFFDGASGLVFCHFTRCGKKEAVEAVLKQFSSKLNIPVYQGFPFGHLPENLVIDLSRKAVIRDGGIVFEAR